MNWSALAAGIVGSGAILAAGVHAGHLDSQAKSPAPHHAPKPTRFEVCVTTLEIRHWFAGDLCDTLRDVTKHQWSRYNRRNGWIKEYDAGCWFTTTTDDPYTLCWDGTIRKER